jgi:hypothetical protein
MFRIVNEELGIIKNGANPSQSALKGLERTDNEKTLLEYY